MVLAPGREPRHQAGALAFFGEPLRVELCRGLGADDDLARRREVLQLEHPCRRGAGDEQLPVWLGGEEEMAWTRMDAHRHAELDGADRALGAADLLDRPLHVGGCAGGPLGVALAREEEQEGVAAELEHVASVPLGDRDQVVEDRRDALHELLGARLAVHRQPLGKRREAGDVDRDERAVDDLLPRRVRPLAPAADEPRQVRREDRGRGGRAAHPASIAVRAGEDKWSPRGVEVVSAGARLRRSRSGPLALSVLTT